MHVSRQHLLTIEINQTSECVFKNYYSIKTYVMDTRRDGSSEHPHLCTLIGKK